MSILIPGAIGLFIKGAIAWFKGPWGKLTGYLILAVLLLWGFRMWLNHHDDKVYASAQEKTVKKLEAQYIGQWQTAMTEAKAMSDEAKAKFDAAAELNRRTDMKFATIFTSLSQIRAAVEERKVIYVKEAAAVPDVELDDALRVLSGIIAAQAPHR